MLEERNEPKWSCFGLMESQRNGGLGQVQGVSQGQAASALLSRLQVLWGLPLELRRCTPVEEEDGSGVGGRSQKGEHAHFIF